MTRKIDSKAGAKDLGIIVTLAVLLERVAVELISLFPFGRNAEAPNHPIELLLDCGVQIRRNATLFAAHRVVP